MEVQVTDDFIYFHSFLVDEKHYVLETTQEAKRFGVDPVTILCDIHNGIDCCFLQFVGMLLLIGYLRLNNFGSLLFDLSQSFSYVLYVCIIKTTNTDWPHLRSLEKTREERFDFSKI